MVTRTLYKRRSLRNLDLGVGLCLRLPAEAELQGLHEVVLDGCPLNLEQVRLGLGEGPFRCALEVSPQHPLHIPPGVLLEIRLEIDPLGPGLHRLKLTLDFQSDGPVSLKINDRIDEQAEDPDRIPRSLLDNYTAEVVAARQAFVRRRCQTAFEHLTHYSFDPHRTRGNIENFLGVCQVPLGIAGPLLVNGEHAVGDFYIPLATSEGTLVASYNRGMKLLRRSGGVTCTVVGDNMQRAPVFVFDNARGGRRFVDWVVANLDTIRKVAEATSSVARLKHIDYYLSNRFAYLRFNFTTGDAAGQNMVGKATLAACKWILQKYPPEQIRRFYLESNLATDKKASLINTMRSRGKRVTAEATIPRELMAEEMGVDTRELAYHNGVANIGAFLAGANNNGLHSANAITAMFIATGQDVANVAESCAAVIYTELTAQADLYISITLPSLIVATHGGGTGLPTQRECLEILGCAGRGKVLKLAEIVAGTVLAGELSLACAISSQDWVSAHEAMGRHRQVEP